MKESIAQSFIISLILFFFGILLLLLFGSINYSKAYKAKNRIITIIEKHGGLNNQAMNEINDSLIKGGYQTVLESDYTKSKCTDLKNKLGDEKVVKLVYPSEEYHGTGGRRHDFCIIQVQAGNSTEQRYYYQVVTFMQFNIPVIGGYLRFPVKGETKILFDTIK